MIPNEEFLEQLKKAELPLPLMRDVNKPMPPAFEIKYQNALDLFGKNNVLLVYGADSPQKELLCAKWMVALMLKRQKTGRWLTSSKVPTSFGELPAGGGVVVFQGIELLNTQQAKVVAQVIRDWTTDGRTLIVSATTQADLEEVVGKSCVKYVMHSALVVAVVSPKPHPIKV